MQAVKSAAKLSGASCSPSTFNTVALPFVILRRLITAILHVLYEEAGRGTDGLACREAVVKVCRDYISATLTPHTPPLCTCPQAAPGLLIKPFSEALNCSRSSRQAYELLHISKSGGTSMCRLAVEAGRLQNPASEMLDNCLVSQNNPNMLCFSGEQSYMHDVMKGC